jgi:hypothetical protein
MLCKVPHSFKNSPIGKEVMSGHSTPKRQLEFSEEYGQEYGSLLVKRHKAEELEISNAGSAPSDSTTFGVSSLAIQDETTLGIQSPSIGLGKEHSRTECRLKDPYSTIIS